MASRSLIAYSRKLRQQISHSIVAHPRILHPPSSSSIPSSFSTLSSQDSDTLSKLNGRDWLSSTEILKIIQNLQNPNSVITALNHYAKRKDYKPNEALYTLIINKLAQGRMFYEIEDLMNRIKTQKVCRLSDDFFYNVIKIYGHGAGQITRAIETLFDMPKYNCWPSVKTFNFVLNLVVSAKVFDVVHEVYLGAPMLGIEVDACCLNILIKGLCENGDLDSAFKVLDEFPKQRCTPNVRTFSTLMHCLCEKGKVEEAFGLFERMENEGVSPDTITFNILISGLRKQGRVEEGMELLERMKLKGCYPNPGSYQEVLYGLLDSRKFVEAKKFMGRMIAEGVSPSFVSYRMLIHGLCEEKLVGDVDWVLKQMVQQGFVPKMGMWRRILQSMASGNRSYKCISYSEVIEN